MHGSSFKYRHFVWTLATRAKTQSYNKHLFINAEHYFMLFFVIK